MQTALLHMIITVCFWPPLNVWFHHQPPGERWGCINTSKHHWLGEDLAIGCCASHQKHKAYILHLKLLYFCLPDKHGFCTKQIYVVHWFIGSKLCNIKASKRDLNNVDWTRSQSFRWYFFSLQLKFLRKHFANYRAWNSLTNVDIINSLRRKKETNKQMDTNFKPSFGLIDSNNSDNEQRSGRLPHSKIITA